ncbi:MAG: hypothetical protein PHW33_00685 [Candidatus Portnoybacteria bacterium]|jgi:branched-subunit amino acid ABC-type transport system permease component|nr:hypothetical protein [Candidatus Portnoybacteria bacterium]
MEKNKIVLWSFLHSLGVSAYITAVATLMNQGNQWFGKEDKFLTPVAVLMLFVLSAAITGSLVLARPILLYLEGRKSDAVKLFLWTLGWLLILTSFAFFGLLLLK